MCYYLMLLANGYAVFDEKRDVLAGEGALEDLIEYLRLYGARRENVIFIDFAASDFDEEAKTRIFTALVN